MAIEYQKGNSVLHRLDARTKLFMFIAVTVAAIVIADPILLCLLFFSVYFLGTRAIDRNMLNKNLRVLVVIFLTFSMFQIIFFTPKDAHFLFYLIPGTRLVPVTIEGIVRGVAVFFRFFSVVLAKLVGGMLPLAAKKLGADPAIMATPFITTIVDACSLILYFQIAQLVFRNMM